MLSQNKIIYRTSTLLVAILSLCLIYGSHSSKKKIEIKLNIQQCYPEGLINDGIRKGKKNDRTELLGSKHQGKNPVILFHICIPIIQRIRT